jgi:flavin-dependent dehydrogenase
MVGCLANAVDVLVLGGGPAGIAAALAARQRGLGATIVDSCLPPIDKPCGEGLLPDGIAALKRLGVSLPANQGHRLRGIRFVSSGSSVESAFPNGCGFGVRRTNLHRILVEHAHQAGVRFLWQSVVTGLFAGGALIRGKPIAARWIIGADGSSSQVRRWAGLDLCREDETRFAFRRHYRITPWSDFVEIHWGAGCQIYITPVGTEEVCVALISRDSGMRLDQALLGFPFLHEKLRGAASGSIEKGAVTVTRRLARVSNQRAALIGDASGSVDAITGEGLCLAFQQAALLADCLASGNLSAYEKGHRLLARRTAVMARLLLLLENRGWLRRRVMRAFVSNQRIFERVVAFHVGAASPADVAVNGLALGWRLLS